MAASTTADAVATAAPTGKYSRVWDWEGKIKSRDWCHMWYYWNFKIDRGAWIALLFTLLTGDGVAMV